MARSAGLGHAPRVLLGRTSQHLPAHPMKLRVASESCIQRSFQQCVLRAIAVNLLEALHLPPVAKSTASRRSRISASSTAGSAARHSAPPSAPVPAGPAPRPRRSSAPPRAPPQGGVPAPGPPPHAGSTSTRAARHSLSLRSSSLLHRRSTARRTGPRTAPLRRPFSAHLSPANRRSSRGRVPWSTANRFTARRRNTATHMAKSGVCSTSTCSWAGNSHSRSPLRMEYRRLPSRYVPSPAVTRFSSSSAW